MSERVDVVEQRLRVLAVMLEPVLTLSRVMGVSLDDLQRLVAEGYFREYRLRGLSLPQVARRLGKSERTIATISKRASESGPLLDESRRIQLQRDVVRLGSVGVVDRARIAGLQPRLDDAEVDAALAQMELAGLIAREGEGWVTVAEHIDMVSEELDARLDSLRHFLTGVAQVVYARFFKAGPARRAFARVWTFPATDAGLRELERDAYERLKNRAMELDAEETDEEKSLATVLFALVEPPDDLAWRKRRR